MSTHFIIFFKDRDNQVCFWDICVYKDIDRSLLMKHLGVNEINYSIKSKEETIVTTKPEVKSQLISSCEAILELLGVKLSFLRNCRVYKNNEVEYDPLLEEKYTLDDYIDTYTEINFEDTKIKFDLSSTYIDIQDDKLLACFDKQELEYYRDLFKKLKRNPTYTEYYDILQSNSEHARHWFFNGNYFYKNK